MTKEDPSTGGLLSKVVKFVRNPTSNWTDLDSISDDKESQYSKQMLKEMIERKRRNDFVRRREFDQLRKLRQREALQGQRTEDPLGRPSFFQSSMASPDERASTLKKIDEIEAQMSQQWWKGKQSSDAPTQPAHLAGVSDPAIDEIRAFAPTEAVSLSPSQQDSKPTVPPLFADDSMTVSGFGRTMEVPLAAVAIDAAPPQEPTRYPAVPLPPPQDYVHDADLEEAAILFANGDHEGAEAALLDVLQQRRQASPDSQVDVWMTLFDLYRATGQHERFDNLGIDYAAQYGRSSPLWFSLPEQLGLASVSQATAVPIEATARREFSWNAPPTLALSSVAALQASVDRAASPWTLSWSRIAAIEEAAVPKLADLFSRWGDRAGQFVFVGADAFNGLLQAHTQSGDRGSSPEWWRLRMAALRLMAKPDDFEMVALEYCVTYEVSPPSWSSPVCGYTDDTAQAMDVSAPVADLLSADSSLASGFGGDSLPGVDVAPVAALRGHIDGDATALLQALEPQMREGLPFGIACDQLIRMDFAAAGSVLNWAADKEAQGYDLRFGNVNRLVAIFFNVVGVNEHAYIVPRNN